MPCLMINCCFLPSLNSFSPPLGTVTKTVRLTQGWTLHHLILPFGGCYLCYLNGFNGIVDTFFLLPTCLLFNDLFHLFHCLAWQLRGFSIAFGSQVIISCDNKLLHHLPGLWFCYVL